LDQLLAGEHLRQNIAAQNVLARPNRNEKQSSLAYRLDGRWHVHCFVFVITSVQLEVWLQ